MKAGHWVYLIDGCEMSWTPSTWDAHQATQVPCGPFCSSWAFAASSTCRHQQPLRCKGKGMPHLPLSMLGLSWSIHVYSHVYIQIYIYIYIYSLLFDQSTLQPEMCAYIYSQEATFPSFDQSCSIMGGACGWLVSGIRRCRRELW